VILAPRASNLSPRRLTGPALLPLAGAGRPDRPHTHPRTLPKHRPGRAPSGLTDRAGKGYYIIDYCRGRRITDNMLPIELQAPRDMARMLARRVKALRLDRGWTQQEVAERAGLTLATYRRFER